MDLVSADILSVPSAISLLPQPPHHSRISVYSKTTQKINMKKFLNYILLLVVLLGTSFTFIACGDDEEYGYENISALDGTWALDYYVYENTGTQRTCTWGELMIFKSGALAWVSRQGGEYSSYTYTIKGNKIKCVNVSNKNDVEELTFKVNSSRLILRNEKNSLVRYLSPSSISY